MRDWSPDQSAKRVEPIDGGNLDGGIVVPTEVKRGGSDGKRRPKFSIIIAVHNTAEFLSDCLDSILEQSFADFELIAVDDASTDGSLFYLSRYAASDPRLKIVQLDRNVGSGGARNAGVAHARGEYVWFIDSDDWIDRESLAKIAARLEAVDPDVLLFGWSRRYADGHASDCPAAKHLSAAPETFALHEWPQAIRILHTPWNKVVRRELILRTRFMFTAGWYQDLPYTYLMLAAAKRISAMPDVLVHYRQRPSGAMRTKGKGHLAVLKQWASVWRLVGAHSPRPEILQPFLFDRMTWHLLEVIRKPDRVPQEHWHEFFEGAERLWAAHSPPGYRFPRGLTGLRYRMMAGKLPLTTLIPLGARLGSRARRIFGLPPAGLVAPRSSAQPEESRKEISSATAA